MRDTLSFFYAQCYLRALILSFFQAVPTSKGQALADEYGIKFFETVKSSFLFSFPLVFLVGSSPTHSLLDDINVAECKNESQCGAGFLFNC